MAVVAAYREELRSVRRRLEQAAKRQAGDARMVTGSLSGAEVSLLATGDGPVRAAKSLEALLDALSVDAVVGIGIAGALSPGLAAGQVVVAASVLDDRGEVAAADPDLLEAARQLAGVLEGAVLSHSEVAIDPPAKARQWRLHGCRPTLAVDLESASWTRVAQRRGVPLLVARAISDRHDETLPLDFNRFRRVDGSVDRGRIWRHALLHPALLGRLMLLRDRVRLCSERLAEFVAALLDR